jgi:hypothetical protein
MAHGKKSFIRQYLDPASRLGEILFGLIMVLSLTLTAEVATRGRTGARELLVAAIGCNLAWGVIDACMYIMNCMTVRSGQARLMKAVQNALDADTALALIRDKMEPELESLVAHDDRSAIYRSMLMHITQGQPAKITVIREDIYGGLVCFWLVFLTCLPAAAPFLIFSDPIRALRISNLLLLVMLFMVGFKWAAYVGANRLLTGLAMVALGLALVGLAVLLGG